MAAEDERPSGEAEEASQQDQLARRELLTDAAVAGGATVVAVETFFGVQLPHFIQTGVQRFLRRRSEPHGYPESDDTGPVTYESVEIVRDFGTHQVDYQPLDRPGRPTPGTLFLMTGNRLDQYGQEVLPGIAGSQSNFVFIPADSGVVLDEFDRETRRDFTGGNEDVFRLTASRLPGRGRFTFHDTSRDPLPVIAPLQLMTILNHRLHGPAAQ